MKTAVVYYTRDGSTRVAAGVLAKRLEADVFELKETKERSKSAGGFIAAGFGAALGRCSRLKDSFAEQMRAYDMICIGSPVWAGKTAPAANTFIRGLDAKGKQIMLFSVQADAHVDSGPSPCMESHKRALEKKGAAVGRILTIHGASPGKTAEAAHIEEQLNRALS